MSGTGSSASRTVGTPASASGTMTSSGSDRDHHERHPVAGVAEPVGDAAGGDRAGWRRAAPGRTSRGRGSSCAEASRPGVTSIFATSACQASQSTPRVATAIRSFRMAAPHSPAAGVAGHGEHRAERGPAEHAGECREHLRARRSPSRRVTQHDDDGRDHDDQEQAERRRGPRGRDASRAGRMRATWSPARPAGRWRRRAPRDRIASSVSPTPRDQVTTVPSSTIASDERRDADEGRDAESDRERAVGHAEQGESPRDRSCRRRRRSAAAR